MLFHRCRVFNAGKVDRTWQERRVCFFVALQRIEQERCGEVINQIQHAFFVPDWIEAEKPIRGVVDDPGFVLTGVPKIRCSPSTKVTNAFCALEALSYAGLAPHK